MSTKRRRKRKADLTFKDELNIVEFKLSATYAATARKFNISVGCLQKVLERHAGLLQRIEARLGYRVYHVVASRRSVPQED